MGCIRNAVNACVSARGFGRCANLRYRINFRNHIGTVGKANKLYFFVEEIFKTVNRQMTGVRVERPFADFNAAIGEAAPWTAVCLMILIGDDDGVARFQELAKGLRQHISILRCRRAERNLVCFNAHDRREAHARLIHFCAAKTRRLKVVIGLNFSLAVKPRQAVNHLAAGIRPAGIFKERLALERGFLKRRKLAAHKINV